MEAIIFTSEQFKEISNRLKEISNSLELITKESSEKFIDNSEFIRLMKISKRTAQIWRDEGRISFSQIGAKIYYKISDVEDLLKKHYIKASEK